LPQWEAGESAPTYPQLEQLADTLKVPIAVFFFPEPPNVPSINETFRTLPEAELDKLPSRIRLLMRKAKAMQLNLIELTQGRNPAERLITRDLQFEPRVNIADMTTAVREYIGVSLEQQRGWRDDEAALKEWRSALQRVGIFVFKDAFRVNDLSGFCLYDDEFPIIYVNNSSTKTRQIFTYFHELAHLIFHTSGIDKVRDRYRRSPKFLRSPPCGRGRFRRANLWHSAFPTKYRAAETSPRREERVPFCHRSRHC
jgi:transcriptional regulator with XRE-family HTH domain